MNAQPSMVVLGDDTVADLLLSDANSVGLTASRANTFDDVGRSGTPDVVVVVGDADGREAWILELLHAGQNVIAPRVPIGLDATIASACSAGRATFHAVNSSGVDQVVAEATHVMVDITAVKVDFFGADDNADRVARQLAEEVFDTDVTEAVSWAANPPAHSDEQAVAVQIDGITSDVHLQWRVRANGDVDPAAATMARRVLNAAHAVILAEPGILVDDSTPRYKLDDRLQP